VVPHLRVWGLFTAILITALFTFFCVRTAVAIWSLALFDALVFGALSAGTLIVCRGLFIGLIDVVVVPERAMDVEVNKDAAGVMVGNERWYLFLDGFISLKKHRAELWTLQHFNGSVPHIPVSAITDEQLTYIKSAMERGRTPEGIRIVVERGRRIAELNCSR